MPKIDILLLQISLKKLPFVLLNFEIELAVQLIFLVVVPEKRNCCFMFAGLFDGSHASWQLIGESADRGM